MLDRKVATISSDSISTRIALILVLFLPLWHGGTTTTHAFQASLKPSHRSVQRIRTRWMTNIPTPSNVTSFAEEAVQTAITDLLLEYDPILLFASRLLSPSTAADAKAMYAWCRRLDELVDDEDASASQVQARLKDWEQRFDLLRQGQPVDALDAALTNTLQRHPTLLDDNAAPFSDMMAGMKSDAVDDRRIRNMEELELYAYQVAGTVGLMLLPLLTGDDDDDGTAKSRQPAIALGQAIQLINILRDARPDAALGRIYLPQDLLQCNDVSEDEVLALRASPGYCRVVELVADRAQQLLATAEQGKRTLPGFGPLLVQIIVELYRGYLDVLAARKHNNLVAVEGQERVKIGTARKLQATLTAIQKTIFLGAKEKIV